MVKKDDRSDGAGCTGAPTIACSVAFTLGLVFFGFGAAMVVVARKPRTLR